MNIIADKITFGGKSLGKIDGKNVFIPFAIPGETYEILIKEEKKDYDNAEIINIIKPSKYRVTPECKYYGKCGGCNMMHIDWKYQQELRKNILVDIFSQNGIDIRESTKIIFGPSNNYRSRFQLNDGGLCEKGTNVSIQITKCLCAENTINEYLESNDITTRPKGRTHIFGSSFVEGENKLKISSENNKIAQEKKIKNFGKKNLKIKENHYFAGTVISPENTITVKIAGKKLSFDVRGFFQSNLFVFEKVINLICDNLSGGNQILDMYAGCGSISTFLTNKYENVVLVEHNRDALVYAEQNLRGTKHSSYGLSGSTWVKTCSQSCGKFDAVVIDPPRSGMEKDVCEYLCESKIPHIISLSCDPSTHARDCSRLIKAGYEIKKTYLLDFYPHTSHIESLVVLELTNE